LRARPATAATRRKTRASPSSVIHRLDSLGGLIHEYHRAAA
jgi:hypothetical protein